MRIEPPMINGQAWSGRAICYLQSSRKKEPENCGARPPSVGNPIHIGRQAKEQSDLDIPGTHLRLVRTYSSQPNEYFGSWREQNSFRLTGGFGHSWSHEFARVLHVTGSSGTPTVHAYRDSRTVLYFTKVSGVWKSDGDVTLKLSDGPNGSFILIDPSGGIETYLPSGQLESITSAMGRSSHSPTSPAVWPALLMFMAGHSPLLMTNWATLLPSQTPRAMHTAMPTTQQVIWLR